MDADRVWNPKRDGHSAPKLAPSAVPNGTLLAVDVATGKMVWKNDADIWGTQIAVRAKHDTLLMNYQAVRHNFFELPSEVGGRLGGFDIRPGAKVWDQQVKYEPAR